MTPKRTSRPTKVPPLKAPSIESLQLNRMTILETVKLWRNCLACLSDPKRRQTHNASKKIKAAIENEWKRRKASVSPEAYFEWPSTEARRADGNIGTIKWEPEGMLTFMGYHVGQTSGLNTAMRQAILQELFHTVLPPVFPNVYLDQFGQPKSAQRLQKMADIIATLTRNAKRRGSVMATAIREWECDLEFLYYNYYIGHFGFGWPSTSAS
ncbi:hypothetical protein [Planctomicrobium sp. SH527]|uniref:hypothetical protein n=1 Tax=Planctomicrobium sp. SH527 TaxID=3448123 RepID=UPI003F5C4D6B